MNDTEVKRLGEEIRVEYMQVSPEMAGKMLAHNEGNRSISDNTVRAYAADMAAGRWDEYAFNPVIFDINGRLKDGQHRLAAVVKSGAVVGMWIADLPTDAGDMYDRGRTRTAKNVLELRGYEKELVNSDIIAALRYVFGAVLGVWKMTDAQLELAIVALRPYLSDLMGIVRSGTHSPIAKKSYVTAAVLAARVAGVDKKTLTEFCEAVNTGIMKDPSATPPIMIRNSLIEARGRSDSTFRRYAFIATQEAINAFCKGYQRQKRFPGVTEYYSPAIARELKTLGGGQNEHLRKTYEHTDRIKSPERAV